MYLFQRAAAQDLKIYKIIFSALWVLIKWLILNELAHETVIYFNYLYITNRIASIYF